MDNLFCGRSPGVKIIEQRMQRELVSFNTQRILRVDPRSYTHTGMTHFDYILIIYKCALYNLTFLL